MSDFGKVEFVKKPTTKNNAEFTEDQNEKIDKFSVSKLFFGITLCCLVAVTNLLARLSVLHLVDDYLPDYNQNGSSQAETTSNSTCSPFCSYFYSLSSSIWAAEIINFIINWKNFAFAGKKESLTFSNILKIWPELVSDVCSVLSEVLLLLIILPKVDVVTGTVVTVLPIMIPALYNCYRHVVNDLEDTEPAENKILVFIGGVLSVVLYIMVIVSYSVNTLEISVFRMISLILYPFLASVTFWQNWEQTWGDNSKKFSKSGRTFSSFVSSIVRVIFAVAFCFLIAGVSNDENFSKSVPDPSFVPWWILLIMISSLLASYFGYCGCKIGETRVSMGLGSLLSIVMLTSLSAISCLQTPVGQSMEFWGGAPLLCLETQSGVYFKDLPPLTTPVLLGIYLVLMIPMIIATNQHIFISKSDTRALLPLWITVMSRDLYRVVF